MKVEINFIALYWVVFSGGRPGWHVFYHFVGAVPGSTELFTMLKRLLLEMAVVSVSESSRVSHFIAVAQKGAGTYVRLCLLRLELFPSSRVAGIVWHFPLSVILSCPVPPPPPLTFRVSIIRVFPPGCLSSSPSLS